MSDLAVLESQFEDHIKDSGEKYKSVVESIKVIESELKNRITFATFSWTLGVLMTVVLATLGFIANQVADLRKDLKEQTVNLNSNLTFLQRNISDTNSTVSYIKGLLDTSDITK